MGGCSFHREPPNNRDFHHISTLYELAGVYKNIGAPSGYITMILWPDIKQTAGANINHEDIVLGIDDVQHGKSRRSGYAAGLVFMIFPVAFSDTSDVRYERVSEKPHEFKNCDEK